MGQAKEMGLKGGQGRSPEDILNDGVCAVWIWMTFLGVTGFVVAAGILWTWIK